MGLVYRSQNITGRNPRVRFEMRISSEILENILPDVERVIELVVGAFEGKEIPNGAIIVGLGAVIGLTLNEQMPGTNKPEAPEIETLLPWLEAGMKFGRDLQIGRVQ
jgi:hypothetical protein